jgi:hypothetical protein
MQLIGSGFTFISLYSKSFWRHWMQQRADDSRGAMGPWDVSKGHRYAPGADCTPLLLGFIR